MRYSVNFIFPAEEARKTVNHIIWMCVIVLAVLAVFMWFDSRKKRGTLDMQKEILAETQKETAGIKPVEGLPSQREINELDKRIKQINR